MRQYFIIGGAYPGFDGQAWELREIEGELAGTMHPDVKFVEITDLDPKPQLGWLYDPSTNSLYEPPPPYIDPRPPIMAELAEIDRASARPLRVLIISDPDIGAGTPERAELEVLELRAADLRAQLDALDQEPAQ